jgi:L-threonylcarbamoyladenylate synthase
MAASGQRLDATVQPFLLALAAGRVCLHPTDTLPGLTFDPRHPAAIRKISEIKQREKSKSFIGLVRDLSSAESYWQSLPGRWRRFLTLAWPGPLSVVWHAGSAAPLFLVSEEGTICLRVPKYMDATHWMKAVLDHAAFPMPTTSVNVSGEPANVTWESAAAFAADKEIYVPEIPAKERAVAGGSPSTVLRIIDSENFKIVRAGVLSLSQIQDWLDAL